MPNLMTHLLVANNVNPKSDIIFYIASIAPDTVSDWKQKDITHFRNFNDRTQIITKLRDNTDLSNIYDLGILLHLFVDWKWDISFRDNYIKKIGEDWFVPYRNELKKAAAYGFKNISWSNEIWQQMLLCDISKYGYTPKATSIEVRNMIERNYNWHKEISCEDSQAFPFNEICDFALNTCNEFKNWVKIF